MDETIGLPEVLKIMKKRLWLIISLTVVAASLSLVLSLYILTPIYQVNTQILINQKVNSEEVYSWSQIETDLQLISTYNDIIKSPVILNKVIEELRLNITPEQLTDQITLLSESDSKVLKIVVEDSNSKKAVEIANKTAQVFKEEIPDLMNVDNINILSSAKLSENLTPVKPNEMLNTAIGAVLGLVLGIGLALILDLVDTTIKDEKDIEEILNIPIIGVVGSIPLERKKKSVTKTQRLRGNQDAWIEK